MFSGESAVETKVLGLLNNIAEVSYLRRHLMDDEFLSVLRSVTQPTLHWHTVLLVGMLS